MKSYGVLKMRHLSVMLFLLSFSLQGISQIQGFMPFSFTVSGSEALHVDEVCVDAPTPITNLTGLLDVGQCYKKFRKINMCKCLEKKGEDHYLIREIQNNPTQVQDELIKMKDDYRELFLSAYSQMTIQAEVQKSLLGISDATNMKKAVCDPQTITEKIQASAEVHYGNRKKALDDLYGKRVNELAKCLKTKNSRSVARQALSLVATPSPCTDLQRSVDSLSAQLKEAPSIEEQVDKSCGLTAAGLTKSSLVTELTEAIKFYANQPEKRKQAQDSLNWIQANKKLIESKQMCRREVWTAVQFIDDSYRHDVLDGSQPIDANCSKDETGLCEAFKNTNASLAISMKNKYKHDPTKECISYSEFKTFKGMPGPELLEKFSSKGLDAMALLETPKDDSTSLKKERLSFLRANPLIAKIAQSDSGKKELSISLNKLAKATEGLTEAQKFKAYLDFMKNDVKKLAQSKDNQNTDAYICQQLAQNFTAIMVADKLPLPEDKAEEQSKEDKFFNAMKYCKILRSNKDATTESLKNCLEMSPIFSLAPKDPKLEEEKDLLEFEKFKGDNCQDYADYMQKDCTSGDKEACRQDYLSTSKFSKLNTVIHDSGVKTALSRADMDAVRSSTDPSKRDDAFMGWWNHNVGANLSKSPIAMRGKESEFAKMKKSDYETFSKVSVPSSFEARSTLASNTLNPTIPKASPTAASSITDPINFATPAQKSPFDASQSSQLQQVPPYAIPSSPKTGVNNFEASKKINDLIPGFDDLSNKDKNSKLTDLKENLERTDPKLAEKLGLNEKIEDIQYKIKKLESSDKPQLSDGRSFKAPEQASSQDSIQGIPSQAAQIKSNSGNSLSAREPKRSSLNEAILSVHNQGTAPAKENIKGRSPASTASLIVSSSTKIDFQQGVLNASALIAQLEGNDTNTLIPESAEKYNQIYNDIGSLKKFLSRELQGQKITSQIVKIIDPSGKPSKYLLFLISSDASGQLNVQSIDRVNTFKNLKNTLGGNTLKP